MRFCSCLICHTRSNHLLKGFCSFANHQAWSRDCWLICHWCQHVTCMALSVVIDATNPLQWTCVKRDPFIGGVFTISKVENRQNGTCKEVDNGKMVENRQNGTCKEVENGKMMAMDHLLLNTWAQIVGIHWMLMLNVQYLSQCKILSFTCLNK